MDPATRKASCERVMTPPILAFLGALGFSVSHLLVTRALPFTNPFTATFVTTTVNALLLLVIAASLTSFSLAFSSGVAPFLLAGLFAPGLARILLYRGIERVGYAPSSVLLGSGPLFAVLVAIGFLGEPATPPILLGTLSIVLGLGLLPSPARESPRFSRWGLLYPLLAALCFALRDNLTRWGLMGFPHAVLAASVTAWTSAVLLYASFCFPGRGQRLHATSRAIPPLVASGVCVVFAYVTGFLALRGGQVVVISPLLSSHPLLSILLSHLFLKERHEVSGRVVLGGVLVVGGAVGITLA